MLLGHSLFDANYYMGQWLNYTYQKIRKAVHGHTIMLIFVYCCNFDNAVVDTVMRVLSLDIFHNLDIKI